MDESGKSPAAELFFLQAAAKSGKSYPVRPSSGSHLQVLRVGKPGSVHRQARCRGAHSGGVNHTVRRVGTGPGDVLRADLRGDPQGKDGQGPRQSDGLGLRVCQPLAGLRVSVDGRRRFRRGEPREVGRSQEGEKPTGRLFGEAATGRRIEVRVTTSARGHVMTEPRRAAHVSSQRRKRSPAIDGQLSAAVLVTPSRWE